MAVLPARGDGEIREADVGSAFSRGDVLGLTAASAASRVDSGDVFGTALADSTKSIQGRVTCSVIGADQIYWANIVAGSAFTAGSLTRIAYAAGGAHKGSHASSTNTTGPQVTVVAGTDDLNQSGESRILVQFVRHDGNILFS